MRVEGGEPRPSPRKAVETKVEDPMMISARGVPKSLARASFEFGRQGLL